MKSLTYILSGIVIGFLLASGIAFARADAGSNLSRIADALDEIADNTGDLKNCRCSP